jgi:Na+:H+ antiporter, NhaA family
MRRAWRFVVDRHAYLAVGGLVAVVWANTYAESYFRLAHALAFLVNDVGMALVLAYLAQEIVEAALPGGTLYPFDRFVVPVLAGIGGTIGAALTYFAYLAAGDEQILAPGWVIAAAPDVVIALATARAIFGRRRAVATALVVALTSNVIGLAIISGHHPIADVHPAAAVLIGPAILVAALLRRRGVTSSWAYVALPGSLSWLGCYWSGIQPSLALLPIVPFLRHAPRDLIDADAESQEHGAPRHFESAFDAPVHVIAFLFVFTNAGISLRGFGTGTWAVMAGSLIGRPIGTLAALWAATRAGLRLPQRVGWKEAVVIAITAAPSLGFGVLFAVSVFPVGALLVETKLGAVLTLIGFLLAFGSARLLRVGRFTGAESVRVDARTTTA